MTDKCLKKTESIRGLRVNSSSLISGTIVGHLADTKRTIASLLDQYVIIVKQKANSPILLVHLVLIRSECEMPTSTGQFSREKSNVPYASPNLTPVSNCAEYKKVYISVFNGNNR